MDFYTKKEYRKGWGEILIFFELVNPIPVVLSKQFIRNGKNLHDLLLLTLYGFSFDKADRLFQKV